jgi:multiple sugar transport system ATP-binding protein
MASIELDNLRKVFNEGGGDLVAVDDLSLKVDDSDFLVLVGPSGCGKSTTLRTIAGLEQPTDGRILFDGEDVTDMGPQERRVAMVFQDYALYPHMTARENMSFGLKYGSDQDDEEIDRRVNAAAEMMGIENHLESRPNELSGGQQQRVALGRAIVREPEVFLMDEPLSNLDAKLRAQMRTELQELHTKLDITTVYVTHDQEEAMTMGDQLAVLNDGELQQIGTPLECYQEPANTFVAGFIGSPRMNRFEGRPNGNLLETDAFDYHLPDDVAGQIPTGTDEVILGIRPEDVKVVDSPTENSLSTEINVVERMGDLTHIYTNVGDDECIITLSGQAEVSQGDEIEIEFPSARIHLFDGKTGEALKNRDSDVSIGESASISSGIS